MNLFLPTIAFLAAGSIGGLLLGLVGVGTALVAVPLLIMFLPAFSVDMAAAPLVALATSMAIVSVGSVSSVLSHHRLGNIDWATVRVIVPFSVVGVICGGLVAGRLSGDTLKWVFCSFLAFIALHMLWPGKPTTSHRSTSRPQFRTVGFLVGLAGSMIGAGGGVFMVPFLNHRGFQMKRAVATSTMIGLPVTVVGALFYSVQSAPHGGNYMLGYIFVPAFLGISLGTVIGAPFGARLASRVPAATLKRVFGFFLVLLALKLAWNG